MEASTLRHKANLNLLAKKANKVNTPTEQLNIGKNVIELLKSSGCQPEKIFRKIVKNTRPNLSITRAVKTQIGLKKIGKGEYGTVFHGCADKECKKQVAIKLAEHKSTKSEYILGKIFRQYGGVRIFAREECSQRDSDILYMEYANSGTLKSFLKSKKNSLRPIHLRTIIAQVLYGLYRIGVDEPSFRHHDLHLDNILINTGKGVGGFSTYLVNGRTYEVDRIGVEALITDYGFATMRGVPNKIIDDHEISGLRENYGIYRGSHAMYDAHLFLNALYLAIMGDAKLSKTLKEVTDFISRIFTPQYLGIQTRVIKNFRLNGYTFHRLKNFKSIFEDRFFNPYTKKGKKLGVYLAAPTAPRRPKVALAAWAAPKKINRKPESITRTASAPKKESITRTASAPKSAKVKVTMSKKGYLKVGTKKCTSYKKSEIVAIAKKAGITTEGKTVSAICELLKKKYLK
jgi:serine/threonine protein kinase